MEDRVVRGRKVAPWCDVSLDKNITTQSTVAVWGSPNTFIVLYFWRVYQNPRKNNIVRVLKIGNSETREMYQVKK